MYKRTRLPLSCGLVSYLSSRPIKRADPAMDVQPSRISLCTPWACIVRCTVRNTEMMPMTVSSLVSYMLLYWCFASEDRRS